MSDRWSVLHLEQGALRLTLLPGIGGRLWDVTFRDRSLLFQNPDLIGLEFDDTRLINLPTRSPQFEFPLWGGEKTWIAPDTSWQDGAPFPALDSGPYKITSQGDTHVELHSAVCPVSHLSVSRRISLTSGAGWLHEHQITNHGKSPRLTGIWSVMMLNTPARIGVTSDTPAFVTVFGSADGLVETHGTCAVVDCSRRQEFKIALPNADGPTLIQYGARGPWLTCSVPNPEPTDRFAHGSPVEVFNSGDYDYCEAEWHSPARTLSPGETLSLQQRFCLWTNTCLRSAPETPTNQKERLSCTS